MTQTIAFPRAHHGFRLGVSSPQLFGELFLELAANKHGELNKLELNMAVIAASCYQGAWIAHDLSGKHIGLSFSSYWKPVDVKPTSHLLAALAARGNRPADLSYAMQVQLLATHAVFMQRQTVQLIPVIEELVAVKGSLDCSELLEHLGFAQPFAPRTSHISPSDFMEMFKTLQSGLAECEATNVATDDCLMLGLNAGFILAGVRAYALKRHKGSK